MGRTSMPVLGASLLGLAGCALAKADPPQVEVAQVELRGAGIAAQSFGAALCVTNPNGTELAFRRVRVGLDVGGAPLADTESELPMRLPPRSSTLVPFAVTTSTLNLGPQLLGIVRSGRLDYRLHGTVQLASFPVPLPFSRSGRLDLLSAGSDLLADAAAPSGTRCAAGAVRARS